MKITVISENNYHGWLNTYKSLHQKLNHNYKISFINIKKNFLQKNNKKYYFYFHFLFLYFFFKNNKQPIIMAASESNKNFFLFFFLRIFNIPIVYIHSHFNYVPSSFNYNNLNFFKKIKVLIKNLDSNLFNFLILINFYKKIDVLFTSAKEEFIASSETKKKFFIFLYKKYKKVILINDKHISEDYFKTVKSKNSFIAFIDEAVPYHEDQLHLGYRPLNKDYYYSRLFRLFDLLEKILHSKVVILPHPIWYAKRLNINVNIDYSNYQIESKFKDRILKNSKLVLLHASSAIFKAINYKKPLLQIAFKGNKMVNYYNNFFKKKFKLQRVYLENFSKKKIINVLKKEQLSKKNRYSNFQRKDNYLIISNYINNFL